ncbi:MAG: M16 family metallopeptidase [Myxococcaceae bacterium]
MNRERALHGVPWDASFGAMADRYRLGNGLTVVIEEQHAAKVAAFQVWVRAGSADERPDQAGLAHLHEHMLFKGTKRRGPGEIAHTVEAHGGEINAWTSFDQTVYHVVIASQFAQTGLDILCDAVRNSAFDAEELAREIEVVCEEIKRSTDMPSRRASRDLFTHAYKVHPYQRPVIGWEETVRSFTREKVLEFYHRHYTPSNLVLTVVGDVETAEVRTWVEELFGGDWGRQYEGAVTRALEPPPVGRRIHLREDDVKEVYLNVAFPIVSCEHEDAAALDMLSMVAGQGEASRLSLHVKRKLSLVNEVHTYAYTPKDAGLWVASMTLPPKEIPTALEETAKVLMDLRRTPVPADELATLKSIVESEAVYQRETVQGLARKLGFYEASAGGLAQEARYYERVANLNPDDLLRVAKKYLDPKKAVVTGLLPPGAALSPAEVERILDRSLTDTTELTFPRKVTSAPLSPMRINASKGGGAQRLIVEQLPSGAKVVIREERAVPLFAVRAAYVGGLRYETEANNGLTTMLGRMMTRGTPYHTAEEISHLIDDLAGGLAGQAGRNSVGMRGEFLSKHFQRGFSLFAECLSRPTFPTEELERERALLLQDIHTREDKPSGLAFDQFHKLLFPQHPYRLSTLGETASVERISQQMLAEYHQRFMDPSQLTLCVVGDVKANAVLELAHQTFAKSAAKVGTPPTVSPQAKPSDAKKAHQTLARAQSHLVLGFLGARVTDAWRRPLEVLSTLLSGQGGRLFVELRDKRSMAYSVSSYAVEGLDPGYFAVYMGTSPEKLDAALAGVQQELKKVREERISEAELTRAQRHLIGAHEIGLQRNSARAALLALDHCYELGDQDFFEYAEQIQSVTVEQVQEVAQRVIELDRAVISVVGP